MNKTNPIIIKALTVTILIVIVAAIGVIYASSQPPANLLPDSTPTPSNTQPTPTPTASQTTTPITTPTPQQTIMVTPTSTPPPTPEPTPATGPSLAVLTFDFDTATPTITTRLPTPFDQTKNLVTAHFSSPTPSGFSVQNVQTAYFKLSQFQGNFLLDNNPTSDTLEIKFSQSITKISFDFATIESEGLPGDQPSLIYLNAYLGTTSVGVTSTRGTWPTGGDQYPQGTLVYDSGGQPFDTVKINIPFQGPKKAVDFLVDTITVTTA